MSDLQEFTLNMLQRAKARSIYIKQLGHNTTVDTVVDEVESEMAKSLEQEPQPELQLEDEDEEEEEEEDEEEKSAEAPPSLQPKSKIPLKMPHVIPLTPHHVNVQVTSASPGGRVSRLKTLAQTINSWDDDYSHHCPPTSRFNLTVPTRKSVFPPNSPNKTKVSPVSPIKVIPVSPNKVSPVSPIKVIPVSPNKVSPVSPIKIPPISPNKIPPTSPNKIPPISPNKYLFGENKISPVSPNKSITSALTSQPYVPTGAKLDAQCIRVSVAEKAAMFQSAISASIREVDPTELSVAERAKLFEGKGRFKKPAATSPNRLKVSSPSRNDIAPKGVAPRRVLRPSMIPEKPLRAKLMLFEKGIKEDSESEDTSSPQAPVLSLSKKREVSFVLQKSPPRSPPKQVRSPSRSPPKATSCSPSRSPPKIISNPSSPVKRRSVSPKANYPGARDTKRIRVNEPKPGKIYPSLTDIEATETETDTDVDNMQVDSSGGVEEDDSENSIVSCSSLGTYIERKAIENSPIRTDTRPNNRYRPSISGVPGSGSDDFNASLACQQVDAFIDEALEGQDFTLETVIDSSSPVATSSPLKNKTKTPSPTRQNMQLNQPLLHTVSFYRLQQSKGTPQQNLVTPKRQLTTIEDSPIAPAERTFSHEDKVNAVVRKLNEEVQAQQRSIAQASKALSLCKSTLEFSDSQENVECERILLTATQKHSALMNEIHRLKTEGILGRKEILSPAKHDLGPSCQGHMTLLDVAVQLKREFVNVAMKGQKVFNFLALAKYRQQVEPSTLVSMGNGISTSNIHGGVLYFPNSFTIGELDPDFRVTVEIFMMETMREYLPHEAKYHIKKDTKGKQTPKKLKSDSQSKALFRHFQHSPAGPDAVQPCRFKPVGSLNIDISTLQRSHWTLEKVLHTSPLDGNVSIKIQCRAEGGVEERGFLTMFQDVSGFGAWHRRWCKLTPAELCFWMYPEDENVNEPLGSIPLRSCVTTRVGPVPRDVCARAATFLLVTTRLPQAGDKDSLVTSCREKYTAVRHLISADTKEDRDLWCKQFNRALANLRAWDPQAHSPDDSLF